MRCGWLLFVPIPAARSYEKVKVMTKPDVEQVTEQTSELEATNILEESY